MRIHCYVGSEYLNRPNELIMVTFQGRDVIVQMLIQNLSGKFALGFHDSSGSCGV
jgi:hypothetical protein